jgi:hypothetical protein
MPKKKKEKRYWGAKKKLQISNKPLKSIPSGTPVRITKASVFGTEGKTGILEKKIFGGYSVVLDEASKPSHILSRTVWAEDIEIWHTGGEVKNEKRGHQDIRDGANAGEPGRGGKVVTASEREPGIHR